MDWIFILAIACAIFGVILVSVFGSWFNLESHELAYLAERILPPPLMGAFTLSLVVRRHGRI